MDTVQVLALSIIQGITEFLPISSSGHLVILPKLVNWPEQGLLFDTALHVGTLLAVMIYFRKQVLTMILGLFDTLKFKLTDNSRLFLMLSLSTLPLVIVGPFILHDVEVYARSLMVIGVTSIVYGLLLYYADVKMGEQNRPLTWKDAFIFGLFQVLASVPGTSRSGICMTAGRFLKLSRTESARYSMLMSIPVILMVGAYGFIGDFNDAINWHTAYKEMLLGIVFSFISALLCIHLLMKWVEKIGFLPFVVYRVLLGVILIYLAV